MIGHCQQGVQQYGCYFYRVIKTAKIRSDLKIIRIRTRIRSVKCLQMRIQIYSLFVPTPNHYHNCPQ